MGATPWRFESSHPHSGGLQPVARRQAVAAAGSGGFDGDRSGVTRHALSLDERGVEEAARALQRLHDELAGIQERSAERGSEEGNGRRQVGVVTMLFDAR